MSSSSLSRLSSLILRTSTRKRIPAPHLSPRRRPLVAVSQHQLLPVWRFNSSAASSSFEDTTDATVSESSSPQEKKKQPLDAFRVLNLERKFDLSADELKQAYRHLMATLHPDKHHSKPLSEQEVLREQASQVIQSYQLLKDTSTRATHMLQLLGHIDDNDSLEEASLRDLLGAEQSAPLLMQVMELREQIEVAAGEAELQPLLDDNNARMKEVCAQLARAFDDQQQQQQPAADNNQNLEKALELTVMLQYYSRIDETIRDKMEH